MKELYRFRQYLTEGVIKEELTWYIEDENEDIRFQNDEYLREVEKKIKEIHPDISDEDLNKIIIMTGEQYSREEDFHGDSITSGNFVTAAVEIYQTDILPFNENLNENEEQGYTLYDTKVEYDNGKTGYMFQLVNSEDREENEIGFDQLFFDDEDNRLEMGVDFNSFDQGSYQEGEVSAEEAMKMYKSLAEGKLNENASGKVLVDKVEPRWIIADPSDIDMKGLGGGRNSTITYYKRESSAQKELDDRINYSKNGGELGYDDEYKGKIASAEVIEVEMQVKIVVK